MMTLGKEQKVPEAIRTRFYFILFFFFFQVLLREEESTGWIKLSHGTIQQLTGGVI